MDDRPLHADREVPARALGFSLASLAIPIVGALGFPDYLGEAGALLWLTALIPAFLLAYYRGWRGAATALAFGMATISLTNVVATVLERPVPDLLFWIVVAYLGISVGIGWVTELLHREREELEDLSLTDILTHLPNRRHARVFLDNEFGAAERGRLLSIVLFDLDDFKSYNDRYGHLAGDEGLRKFAEILASTTRRMNLSSRFGGEEFLTILSGSDEDGALAFAERVKQVLSSSQLSHGSLTVSAGVAAYHPSMSSPDELIAAADLGLYRAKREGKDRVRVFGRVLDPTESVDASPLRDAPVDAGAPDQQGRGYPRRPEEIGNSHSPPTLLPRGSAQFGSGRQALLVQGEAPVRAMVSMYLAREGFVVEEAGDSIEGIRALGREFDVVITDFRDSGAGGSELVTAVKARWPETQVLVITGVREAEVAAEVLSGGADRYLFTPFGIPELQAHLMEALARRDRLVVERQERRHLSQEARGRADAARGAVVRGARALVDAVETRDPHTRGHSSQVARYAVAIAEALGPEREPFDPEPLTLACELHDIGKIEIAATVLNKEGLLTEEELDQVRRHPRTGRRILEPILGDDLVLAVTGWHHERWDGTGYPDGLAGEAIPLPARIVSIADALDAMTSPRAYRRPLEWGEAVSQILERAGSQFDPNLMSAFKRALPRLEELFRASGD